MPNFPSRADSIRRMTIVQLRADVDEFLDFLAILNTPEVDAIRDRLEGSLRRARQWLVSETDAQGHDAFVPPVRRRPAAWLIAMASTAVVCSFGVAATIKSRRLHA